MPEDPQGTTDWENGFIFLTNKFTEKEVFARKLFGLPEARGGLNKIGSDVDKLDVTSCCFLFNLHTRILWGMFRPDGKPQHNIVENAFMGKFPVQLKFKTWVGPYMLKESDLPKFIKNQFNRCMLLTKERCHKLLRCFLDHGEKPTEDPGKGFVEPDPSKVWTRRSPTYRPRGGRGGGGMRGRGGGRGGHGGMHGGRGGGPPSRGHGRYGMGPVYFAPPYQPQFAPQPRQEPVYFYKAPTPKAAMSPERKWYLEKIQGSSPRIQQGSRGRPQGRGAGGPSHR